MKKLFRSGMLLVAALAFLTIASCSKDDDSTTPSDNQEKTEVKPIAAKVSYTFDVYAEFAEYVNVELTYTDMAGQTKTLSTLTAPKKEIYNATTKKNDEYYELAMNWDYLALPILKTFSIKFSLKEGVVLPTGPTAAVPVRFQGTAIIHKKYNDSSYDDKNFDIPSISAGLDVPAENFVKYLDERLNVRYSVVTLTVDENGQCVVKHNN